MRLFVAVWPARRIIAKLEALPRPSVEAIRWTPSSSWHITLRFVGEGDPDEEAARLDAAALPARPVTASLGPKVTRFGDRVLHVPVRGLDDVARAVGDDGAFRGHITLARSHGSRRLARLVGTSIKGSWEVGEVTLVRSHLGGGPPRYEVIHRTPLQSPARRAAQRAVQDQQ